MSDSDSELSSAPAIPSDATLEKALRAAVAKVFETNNRDDLTVKRMRTAAEKALDLPEGFFKGDDRWKADSERIIKDEADIQEAKQEENAPSEKEETPVKAKPKKAPSKPKEKPDKKVAKPKEKPEKKVAKPGEKPEKKAAKPPKRASPNESSKPAKRQKTAETDGSEDELSSPPSDVSEEKPKAKKEAVAVKTGRGRPKGSSKPKMVSKAADSDEDKDKEAAAPLKTASRPKKEESKVDDSDEEEEVEAAPKKAKAEDFDDEDSSHAPLEKANGAARDANSDSELSEVLDPTPKPKRQRRKSSEVPSKAEKKSKKPSKTKEDSNITPDEAEIKRLQGWLIKCGIRKMWFRELAPYDTPKERIKHLKGMLTDAGMDGRYSIEKATQIKEERELMADLEMVKEGAKRWGADSDSEEAEVNDNGRPKRKLARGLRNVDFLDSDDGEETS